MASTQLMQWSEASRTGIRELDEQHKAFIEMLNDLHQAIVARSAKDAVRRILDRLAEHPFTHFQQEEDLMRRARYSAIDSHLAQHCDLNGRVEELRANIDKGGSAVTFALLHLLKSWLANHINEADRRFGAFVATSDQAPAARRTPQLAGSGLLSR